MRHITLLVGFCLLFAAWAYAQTQSEVIVACVRDKDGSVRIVGSAGDCGRKEQPLSWNQEGPQGPPGSELRVFDGNGSDIGPLLDWTPDRGSVSLVSTVFIESIGAIAHVVRGTGLVLPADGQTVYFESHDCQGQAYARKTEGSVLIAVESHRRFFVGRPGPLVPTEPIIASRLVDSGCILFGRVGNLLPAEEVTSEIGLTFPLPLPLTVGLGAE